VTEKLLLLKLATPLTLVEASIPEKVAVDPSPAVCDTLKPVPAVTATSDI